MHPNTPTRIRPTGLDSHPLKQKPPLKSPLGAFVSPSLASKNVRKGLGTPSDQAHDGIARKVLASDLKASDLFEVITSPVISPYSVKSIKKWNEQRATLSKTAVTVADVHEDVHVEELSFQAKRERFNAMIRQQSLHAESSSVNKLSALRQRKVQKTNSPMKSTDGAARTGNTPVGIHMQSLAADKKIPVSARRRSKADEAGRSEASWKTMQFLKWFQREGTARSSSPSSKTSVEGEVILASPVHLYPSTNTDTHAHAAFHSPSSMNKNDKTSLEPTVVEKMSSEAQSSEAVVQSAAIISPHNDLLCSFPDAPITPEYGNKSSHKCAEKRKDMCVSVVDQVSDGRSCDDGIRNDDDDDDDGEGGEETQEAMEKEDVCEVEKLGNPKKPSGTARDTHIQLEVMSNAKLDEDDLSSREEHIHQECSQRRRLDKIKVAKRRSHQNARIDSVIDALILEKRNGAKKLRKERKRRTIAKLKELKRAKAARAKLSR